MFTVSIAQFVELNICLKNEASFSRWHDGKFNPVPRVQSTPISLLFLTSLCFFGRGWTFDDLSENTSIKEETIRIFFHAFIDFGSTACTPCMCDHLQNAKRQASILQSTKWQAFRELLGVLMRLISCVNVCCIVCDKHTLVSRCLTRHVPTILQLTITGRFLPPHLDIPHNGTAKPWLCLITS